MVASYRTVLLRSARIARQHKGSKGECLSNVGAAYSHTTAAKLSQHRLQTPRLFRPFDHPHSRLDDDFRAEFMQASRL